MSGFGYVDHNNFLLDEVSCTGGESTLQECAHAPWRDHDCHSYETAGAICIVGKGKHGGVRDATWNYI